MNNETRDLAISIVRVSQGLNLIQLGLANILKHICDGDIAIPDKSHGIPPNDTKTCNLPQAAKMLGVSRTTIDRLCRVGKLRYVKDDDSGYRRVVVSSIKAYFNSRLQAQKRPPSACS